MLYQYGMRLLEMYYMNDVLTWYTACRVEYHNILVWHLEVDVEKVMQVHVYHLIYTYKF